MKPAELLKEITYMPITYGTPYHTLVERLRHDAFTAEGQIDPLPDGRMADCYDDMSNALNFATVYQGEFAGAIRLHLATAPYGRSPAGDAFPDVKLMAGSILDVSRLVTAPLFRGALRVALPLVTMRIAAMAIKHYTPDVLTVTVRPEHVPWYERNIFAKQVTEPRAYPMLKKSIVLMTMDCQEAYAPMLKLHPHWDSTPTEREMLFAFGLPQ